MIRILWTRIPIHRRETDLEDPDDSDPDPGLNDEEKEDGCGVGEVW